MVVRFASHLSLIAFTVSVMQGLLVGGDLEGSLRRALAACVAFYGLGLFCGELARRVIDESVQNQIAEEREKAFASLTATE